MDKTEYPRAGANKQVLSVVVPCFNEEAVLRETHRQLVEVFSEIRDMDFELLYVDDGSLDATLAILEEIQTQDGRVRVVSLSRNFGQQTAVTAGLEHAIGDAVVVIDADLQDPPGVIRAMLDCWRRGVDVAYGKRDEREGEPVYKLWGTKAFCRLMQTISDVPMPLDTGDFRLMDRKVVDALLAMPERDRFVRGMVAWVGFRQEPVPYRRARRFAGRSKYPLQKLIRLAAVGIFSFSVLPLRLATWIGFATAGLSVLGIVYALIMRFLDDVWLPGWTLLLIALLFTGGVQLVFLGVMGEYLGRVYGEVKRRPLYFVRERLGFPEGQAHSFRVRPR